MPKYTSEERENHFWKCIDIKTENECWNWNKHSKQDGYGRTSFNNKTSMAHRIAFELHNKRPITYNMILCHSCDNRLCCNPNHLREGTHKDNSDDKFERGRFIFMKGETNGRAKLTNDIADTIRKRYKEEKITQSQLAKEYNVSQHTISKIISNKRYI